MADGKSVRSKYAYDRRAPANKRAAILSVYDKTGLLDLAKGLVKHNVRLLASGGTSKLIREGGFPVEYEIPQYETERNMHL